MRADTQGPRGSTTVDGFQQLHRNGDGNEFGKGSWYLARYAGGVGALTTTDVIVLDRSRTIVYHGAIDDQYGFGYSIDAPRYRYLADALAWIAGGKPEGDRRDAPQPRQFVDGWLIGEPDAVFQFSEPLSLKAGDMLVFFRRPKNNPDVGSVLRTPSRDFHHRGHRVHREEEIGAAC